MTFCHECHHYPHEPGCPNDDKKDPEPVFTCAICGTDYYEDGIYAVEYIHILDKDICEDCINEHRKVV